jgi:ATP-dependent RNA helicase DeaD
VLLVPYTRRRKAESVLRAAGVEAAWSGPPAADEIRKQDTERLLTDPVLTEETTEEDVALARALLEQRSAEDVAAALVRLYRSKLPAPEELFDGGAYLREPMERFSKDKGRSNADGPKDWSRDRREAREGASDGVWFRLNIGREKNADPKWLIPLICRRGHVTKPEIGAIRVFGRETKFEIVPAAAERFAAAIKGAHDDGVRIEAAGAPEPRGSGPKKPFSRPRKDFSPREKPVPREERQSWSPVDGAEVAERPQTPRPEGGKPPFNKKPGGQSFKKAPFKKGKRPG